MDWTAGRKSRRRRKSLADGQTDVGLRLVVQSSSVRESQQRGGGGPSQVHLCIYIFIQSGLLVSVLSVVWIISSDQWSYDTVGYANNCQIELHLTERIRI